MDIKDQEIIDRNRQHTQTELSRLNTDIRFLWWILLSCFVFVGSCNEQRKVEIEKLKERIEILEKK